VSISTPVLRLTIKGRCSGMENLNRRLTAAFPSELPIHAASASPAESNQMNPMMHCGEPEARQFQTAATMMVVPGPCAESGCVLYVEGPLRLPICRDLRHRVRGLLRRGEREIVLDLARVATIDAAGVGELVRAYNMTVARDGLLRIVHVTARVREMLERAGLFTFMNGRRTIAG
jgi:anti-anti-sigma factor